MPHLDLPDWLPIEVCGFTLPTYDLLFRNDIHNVGKLSELSILGAMSIFHMTKTALFEIITWMKSHTTTEEIKPIPEPDWNAEIIVIEFK